MKEESWFDQIHRDWGQRIPIKVHVSIGVSAGRMPPRPEMYELISLRLQNPPNAIVLQHSIKKHQITGILVSLTEIVNEFHI
jgi:hypothetical protein